MFTNQDRIFLFKTGGEALATILCITIIIYREINQKKLQKALYSLEQGSIHLEMKQCLIGTISVGELFGLETIFSQTGRTLFSIKVESDDAVAYSISREQVKKYFHPDATKSLATLFMNLLEYRSRYVFIKSNLFHADTNNFEERLSNKEYLTNNEKLQKKLNKVGLENALSSDSKDPSAIDFEKFKPYYNPNFDFDEDPNSRKKMLKLLNQKKSSSGSLSLILCR